MSDLKYRELKNVGYKSKDTPKVYFCAHPQDFAVYFDEIKNDVISGHGCSVWYDDEDGENIDTEARLADLAGMNLFVVPVTAKLLTEPCRAMDCEIPFAREHNIPILPLMQEQELDELFTKKFGNLQYLEKTARYAGALGFAEKLQKYLSSVLVGDELNKKIKEAFDAYIFLSYRKKDRRHARELMRIIHENEILRDVAIWYDEFLTPGEDYNVNIASSLKKSNIFALAVTPSLLEYGNYIMTTEFPEAVKEGKPIVPVELVCTDREELARAYKDIPECIGADEREKLAGKLAAMLCGAALQSRASLPEHKFLIGLAYLGGIDVETNQSRALSLILEAADCGYAPAVEKLAAMYRTGDGVKHDLHEAAGWQRKYVSICEQRHADEPSLENGLELAEALATLGDTEEKILSHESSCMADFCSTEPPQASHGALALARALAAEFPAKDAKRKVVSLCYAVSEMYFMRRNEEEAEKYLLEALEILKRFANSEKNEEAVFDVAECYRSLAANRRYGFEKIIKFHLKEMRVYEFAHKYFGTIESARKLAECYDTVVFVYAERGFKKKEAWECAKKYLALMEQISKESGFAEEKRRLADKYVSYAGHIFDNNWSIVGDDEREASYARAEEILLELLCESEDIKNYRELADVYSRCAYVYEEEKNYGRAEAFMLKCIDARKTAAEKFGSEEDAQKAYIMYGSLASMYTMLGRDEDAKKCYIHSLRAERGDPDFYSGFLSVCMEHSYTECLKALVQNGYETYVRLVMNAEGSKKSNVWSGFVEKNRSAISFCRENGMADEAITICKACKAVCEKLAAEVDRRNNAYISARLQMTLGEIYEDKNMRAEMEENYRLAAEMMAKVAEKYGYIDDKSYTAYIYLRHGWYLEKAGELGQAEELYMRALKLRLEAYLAESTGERKAAMNECSGYLASIYSKQGNLFYRIKKSAQLAKIVTGWAEQG